MAYSPMPLMCTLVLVFLHIHAYKSLPCPRDDDCTCTANEPCELECIGAGHCDGHTLTCQPYQPCLLRCVGDEACLNSTLVSNNASSVSVKCIGEDACLHTAIACESTESCSLTVASGCDATTPAPFVASTTTTLSTFQPTLSPLLTAMPSYAPTVHDIFLVVSHPPTPLPTLNPTVVQAKVGDTSLLHTDNDLMIMYYVIVGLLGVVVILCIVCCVRKRKHSLSARNEKHMANGREDSADQADAVGVVNDIDDMELAMCPPRRGRRQSPAQSQPNRSRLSTGDLLFDVPHKTQGAVDEKVVEGALGKEQIEEFNRVPEAQDEGIEEEQSMKSDLEEFGLNDPPKPDYDRKKESLVAVRGTSVSGTESASSSTCSGSGSIYDVAASTAR